MRNTGFVPIHKYPYLGIGPWQKWAGWSFYKYLFHGPKDSLSNSQIISFFLMLIKLVYIPPSILNVNMFDNLTP